MKYHRPSHRDEPLWITHGPADFAPAEPRKRPGLFRPAPKWMVACITWALVAIAWGGFWALYLHQLAEQLS